MKKALLLSVFLLLFSLVFSFGFLKQVNAAPDLPPGAQLGLTNPWFVSTPVSSSQQLLGSLTDPTDVNSWNYGFSQLTQLVGQGSILAWGPVPIDEEGQPITDITRLRQTDNGAVGFAIAGIGSLVENKPASSVDYVAYMGSKLHIPGTPEPAYAAGPGYGFQALRPILTIWTLSRNIAYFMFALIFIVVGLMIMFRVKIDPKTVATIQNALPKIIFALIVVTFSYAIAGFLIDIMYLLMSLVFLLARSITGDAVLIGTFEDKILNKNNSIFDFYFFGGGLTTNLASAVAIMKVVFAFFFNPSNMSTDLNLTQIDTLAAGIFGIFGFFAGGAVGILAFFVIAIMILWALFKTWLMLLGAYVAILLQIMFAPLRLTLDAVPGQNQFMGWLKDLMVNLLVFPFVTILMLVGVIITNSLIVFDGGTQRGFVPPLLGNSEQGGIQALIGLGILLTIPKAIDILRDTFKAPAFKYGNAWMDSMKFAQNPFGATTAARGWVAERYINRVTGGLTSNPTPSQQVIASQIAGQKLKF